MTSLSDQLINQLAASGVRDFFGVQGGACAHLIRSSSMNRLTRFTPVLNEQSAGLCAHGYFKATGRPAGVIVTTGPGFSNLVTGMLTCYFDRVPLVVLCGQVNREMNRAKEFGTRMYGFQEVDHASIAAHFSDHVIRITGPASFTRAMNMVTNLDSLHGTLFLEIQDDLQRADSSSVGFNVRTPLSDNQAEDSDRLEEAGASEDAVVLAETLLRTSTRPLLIVGAGVMESTFTTLSEWGVRERIPTLFSWGAQSLGDPQEPLHQGLFGNHSPGRGNELLREADLLICIGVGLLQHQVGKDRTLFGPKASIIYVNSDFAECSRVSHDFSPRAESFVSNAQSFACSAHSRIRFPNAHYWPDVEWHSLADLTEEERPPHSHEAVSVLTEVLKYCPSDAVVFSDAGATLSWTYQAANLVKSPPIYTAYNLHGMGYALPAAVGASVAGISTVLSVNGDGGLMMNLQEFALARSGNVKTLVLDNQGYGIIRQTQDDYLDGDHSGSSPHHPNSPLPEYDVTALSSAFGIPSRRIKPNELVDNLTWFFASACPRTLVVDIDLSLKVLGVGL